MTLALVQKSRFLRSAWLFLWEISVLGFARFQNREIMNAQPMEPKNTLHPVCTNSVISINDRRILRESNGHRRCPRKKRSCKDIYPVIWALKADRHRFSSTASSARAMLCEKSKSLLVVCMIQDGCKIFLNALTLPQFGI